MAYEATLARAQRELLYFCVTYKNARIELWQAKKEPQTNESGQLMLILKRICFDYCSNDMATIPLVSIRPFGLVCMRK